MNLAATLAWGTDYLTQHQIADPHREAELLLEHALEIPRAKLLTSGEQEIESTLYESYIHRRAQHEPAAYIIGNQPFMGLTFAVDDNVLIPRPETELLVETILTKFKETRDLPAGRQGKRQITIVDVGTGCGCIAISLAKYLPNAKVIGVDSSKAAINLALNNAQKNGVEKNCCFLLGDLFSPLKERVDLIVSNPPYIPSAEIETLQPEVRDWEPRIALDGGRDGLEAIRKIIDGAPEHLNPGGRLAMEFGFGQAQQFEQLANKKFNRVEIIKDYAGIDRILIAT